MYLDDQLLKISCLAF